MHDNMVNRALVTGGGGFVGGHLAKTLVSRGYRVRVLTRDPRAVADLALMGIDVAAGDLRDRAVLSRAMAGVTAVFHLAACRPRAGVRASEYRVVNVEGVEAVIEVAAAAQVRRVVVAGTVAIYGRIDRLPADEESPVRPRGAYQISRFEGEQAAKVAAARAGVEVVIARPTGVYGPGDRRHWPVFRRVARRRWIGLGSGRGLHHLTYVDDVAEGLRLCGEAPAAAGRTYILGGPEVTMLRDLVRLIARETGAGRPWLRLPVWPALGLAMACEACCRTVGVVPPINRRGLGLFTTNRAFDITRARHEIGYAPRVGLREGVRRSIEWYRGRGWL